MEGGDVAEQLNFETLLCSPWSHPHVVQFPRLIPRGCAHPFTTDIACCSQWSKVLFQVIFIKYIPVYPGWRVGGTPQFVIFWEHCEGLNFEANAK